MNFGEKALQVLRTVAPTLALAAGGPFGPLAAAAIHAALGTDPGDPKAAETALLNATPDQLLALKKADNDFEVRMKELGIEEKHLAYDDTANARGREIAVKDWTPRILAFGVVTLTIAMEGLLMFFGQPKGMDGVVLGRILGTWDGATMLVLAYYFGSSAGSASKTDTINQIAAGK
jgi:hypothetical protein